ncbi:MAG TPA: hypothetical protein VG452_06855 [Egibacteraceae bacterium]|nr:prevent-host-death protein [Actinomycetota bacterium]HWB71919.1 hypothetical protein [Egibacteraceae bacterium]
MFVPDVSANDAARRFVDLLDADEQRGERFTTIRRGKAIAQLGPVTRGRGDDVKSLLRRHRPDPSWAAQLDEARQLLTVEDRG